MNEYESRISYGKRSDWRHVLFVGDCSSCLKEKGGAGYALHPDFLLTSSASVSSGCCLQTMFCLYRWISSYPANIWGLKIVSLNLCKKHRTGWFYERKANKQTHFPLNMVKWLPFAPRRSLLGAFFLIAEAPEVPVPQAAATVQEIWRLIYVCICVYINYIYIYAAYVSIYMI